MTPRGWERQLHHYYLQGISEDDDVILVETEIARSKARHRGLHLTRRAVLTEFTGVGNLGKYLIRWYGQ